MSVVKFPREMRPATQRLELADNLFPDVIKGKKTEILRWKDADDIELGPLEFYSAGKTDLSCLVLVTGTRSGTMKSLASAVAMDPSSILLVMKKQYPDITDDAKLRLIEFMSPDETAQVLS